MVKYTIEKLLKDGLNKIEKRDYNNPFLDVQLILSYLLGKDKIYLHMYKDEEVSECVADKYYAMVQKRNTGYPLQYMLGVQEFMGLDLDVAEGVLIPRADTEILVEKIISYVKLLDVQHKTIKILDLGTGSGAIAVSLAYYIPQSFVTAVDISDIALSVAQKNADKYNLKNINVVKGNIFGNLNINSDKYDIVVSNPPYIEQKEIEKLQTEVSIYEPKLALDGGVDGLDYYRQIVDIYRDVCAVNSILSVEIGYNQGRAVCEIFESTKMFAKIELSKDLSQNDRVVTGFL